MEKTYPLGAVTFGDVWRDPAKPKWDKSVEFRPGTCVFKVHKAAATSGQSHGSKTNQGHQILMTEATSDEVPILKGAPIMQAVLCQAARLAVLHVHVEVANPFSR
jgi:hypothetical protein